MNDARRGSARRLGNTATMTAACVLAVALAAGADAGVRDVPSAKPPKPPAHRMATSSAASVPAPSLPHQATESVLPLTGAVADAIAAAVGEDMSKLGIPGLSIAVAEAGALRFAAGYGFADVENEVAATAETVYRLASVSKPITAAAALQLAERGRLDLDAPAWRYCTAYPPKPWTVTARELLCHQGGIRSYHPGELALTRRFASVAEALSVFKDDPLVYEPGTAVVYSTYGYCLLGCVVEGAAGRPFIDVLRDGVFGPAGMTSTQIDDARTLIPHRASGYVRTETGELVNSGLADMTYKVPGGGLCGTAPDVARFGAALVAGRLLSPATMSAMLTPQKLRTGRITGFGLGVTLSMQGGRREAWHIGGQERVSTLLYMRPESGLSIAILSNLERVQTPLLDLARRIAELMSADHPQH